MGEKKQKLSTIYFCSCFILTFLWVIIPIFRWDTCEKRNEGGNLSKITELRKHGKESEIKMGRRIGGCEKEAHQAHSKPWVFSTDKHKSSTKEIFSWKRQWKISILWDRPFCLSMFWNLSPKLLTVKIGYFSLGGTKAVRHQCMYYVLQMWGTWEPKALQVLVP